MRVVVVEDEMVSARNLIQILRDIGKMEIVCTLDSIEDTVNWFSENHSPDLLFLDIHLADGSAFEIFQQISIPCPVIFTTAYDEYALKAFEVNSVSYLLKPIKQDAVQKALEKLTLLRDGNKPDKDFQALMRMLTPDRLYKSHFLVSVNGQRLVPLKSQDIACIHISEGLVHAYTLENKLYHLDLTLDELETCLDPSMFYRANRQCILSRHAIQELVPWFNHRIKVELVIPFKEDILISKVKVKSFKDWLEE
jgi:two-component system LytT family response regulator